MTPEEGLNFHEQFLASLERNVAALVEAQQRTDQNVSRLEQSVARLEHQRELAEHQFDTDAKLDRLAETLQKFLDSQLRRNGGD